MPPPPVSSPSCQSVEERAHWLDRLFQASPLGIAVTRERVFVEVNDLGLPG